MREFLNKPAGKVVAVVILLIGVGLAAYMLYGSGSPAAAANERMFVDASTGKAFSHKLVSGESLPVAAPSGEKAGYPAELCYWNPDGSSKPTPDYVLLNEMHGLKGPTFCPVCHRLVVGHNPSPAAGQPAPPTEEEYNKDPKRYQSDR